MPRNPYSFHFFPSVFPSIFKAFTFSLHLSQSPRGAAWNSLAWKFYDSNLRDSLKLQVTNLILSTNAHTQLNKGNHGMCKQRRERQLLGYWGPLAAFPLSGHNEPRLSTCRVGPIASNLEQWGQNQAVFPLLGQKTCNAALKLIHRTTSHNHSVSPAGGS